MPRAQILRERVQQCYRKEGVNHYENCREVCNAAPCATRVSGERGFWRARLLTPCRAARPSQHVNAYLDCIKDVGLSRINWTKQT